MKLFIIIHGFSKNPSSMDSVIENIKTSHPDAEIYSPQLPLNLFSTQSLNQIVKNLLIEIDKITKSYINSDLDIVFVGHSMGALIARKAYLVACGETIRAPFETEYYPTPPSDKKNRTLVPSREWSKNVSKLILLAGMNRGWRISHHLGFWKAVAWTIGIAFSNIYFLFSKKQFVINRIRSGSKFITQLRIQWIAMRQAELGTAYTVQLLGSVDDMVAPEDNIDLVSGGEFLYLDVPNSGHANVIEMDHTPEGQGRSRVFDIALNKSMEEIQRESVIPSDDEMLKPNTDVKHVAFVIHGIRDKGYWTHKIARKIRKLAELDKTQGSWATETSSYGYFPMLPFIFPWHRRRKVEWLMDQYAEAIARYPNASFSYVGHSNGTYLLASALQLYPCCVFDNIVFAGSVVKSNYDWNAHLNATPPQVKSVLNFVATDDVVVATFPKFLGQLRQDLGSAGHDGFTANQSNKIHQIFRIEGGHSAGIAEKYWDDIARFVTTGTISKQLEAQAKKNSPSLLSSTLGRFPIIGILIVICFFAVIWHLFEIYVKSTFGDSNLYYMSIGASAVAYMILLFSILTKA